jgi:hypothetical protein
MFDVYFKYTDGNEVLCPNISKIEIETSNGYQSIAGDQLINHHFRIHGTFHLYSDKSNYSVVSHGILFIQVVKK